MVFTVLLVTVINYEHIEDWLKKKKKTIIKHRMTCVRITTAIRNRFHTGRGGARL